MKYKQLCNTNQKIKYYKLIINRKAWKKNMLSTFYVSLNV